MPYRVKEIFYTLQGEGAHAGRPAVFCRFAGCNLWTGHERDRPNATCTFCDTDFVGTDGPHGGTFQTPDELADAVLKQWPAHTGPPSTDHCPQPSQPAAPFVVCTGGEPLLQLDTPLLAAFHRAGLAVAIETNGTRPLPPGSSASGSAPSRSATARVPAPLWVTVSPKAGAPRVLTAGDELKLVYPQPDLQPHQLAHLGFTHFYLQPMAGPHADANTQAAIQYCLEHPQWKLSLQTHKLVGLR